jgi:superfamily II helicase
MSVTSGQAGEIAASHAHARCELRDTCYRAAYCMDESCSTLEHLRAIKARVDGGDDGAVDEHTRKPERLKWCRICREKKPISEFARNARYKDGHDSMCRACRHDKAVREWRQKRAAREAAGETVRRTRRRWED